MASISLSRCNQTTWSKIQAPNTILRANPSSGKLQNTPLATVAARVASRTKPAHLHQLVPAATPPSTPPTRPESRICHAGLCQRRHRAKRRRKTLTSTRRTTCALVSAFRQSRRIEPQLSATSERAGASTSRSRACSET